MLERFFSLFPPEFLPHGHCFFWKPDILWLHVVSDALITISYYSIPLALIALVRKRDDLAFNWMFGLFASFIFLCGTTHLISIWTMWSGYYYIEGSVKLLTGLVSAVTAVLLWPLIPKAVALPSVDRYAAEIEERKKVEVTLRDAQTSLERRVEERTTELTRINDALQEKSSKLQRFHDLSVNRELEMIKLKREINALLSLGGHAPRYDVSPGNGDENKGSSS